MTSLLRRVWESLSLRRESQPDWMTTLTPLENVTTSLGDFDKLPSDIVTQIIVILGPKGAAIMSTLSKSWRLFVSDNRLWIMFLKHQHQLQNQPWDLTFFAETHLRSPPPLMKFSNQVSHLSFMQIYGQRAQVPGAIIIDGGSGYCKFGWSKYDSPSGRSATFLEFGDIEAPVQGRLGHFYLTIYSRMQVAPNTQPIVISLPLSNCEDTPSAKASRRQLKKAIYSALFAMNVPAVCAINQASLALYGAKRTSGIVVNIGFQVTSIVPILHGKILRNVGVKVIRVGAAKLTRYLKELMQQNNINFRSLFTVRTLKENLCYIAEDYESELSKDTHASFAVGGEGVFTLSRERFQTGEILFKPHLTAVHDMGLHHAVAQCMDHCRATDLAGDDTWFKTVVLAGGTACLPGLAARLEKELQNILPAIMAHGIRVLPPPFGGDTAWFGAKLISNLSTFTGPWCTTKMNFHRKPKFRLLW